MNHSLLSFLVSLFIVATASAQQYVSVFNETIANCRSEIEQGGYFSESLYFVSADNADHDGWTSQNAYPSERAVKLSSKTKLGTITTPAITFSTETAAEVKVCFRAQTWNTGTTDDCTKINVQIAGDANSVQTLDFGSTKSISNRSDDRKEITFTNVPSGSNITFSAVKDASVPSRFFIADVEVFEKVEDAQVPQITLTASYHHFDNLMAGEYSECRGLVISGENLTDDIVIEPVGESNFEIEKDVDWDAKLGGWIDITFTPQNAGIKDNSYIIKSGDVQRTLILNGQAKVYAPECVDATDVADNSAVCCWSPLAGIDSFNLDVYTKSTEPLKATNLMITKYIEGSSNNRAIEIFNGTGSDISLKVYKMRLELDGAGGLTKNEYAFADDAVIANGATFTIANAQYSALRDIADELIGYSNGGYANVVTFTGNDAIGLFDPYDNLIDVIGYQSDDINPRVEPNWGTDKTYYRKPSVYMPHDKFYPSEWNVFDKDYAESFGSHQLDAEGPVSHLVKRVNVPGNATSATVDGLNSGTTYYYAIQAFSNNIKTPYSNEISFVTTGEASVAQIQAQSNLHYCLNGNVLTVDADNARLYGLNGVELRANGRTFELPCRGVYVLQANGMSRKVVY